MMMLAPPYKKGALFNCICQSCLWLTVVVGGLGTGTPSYAEPLRGLEGIEHTLPWYNEQSNHVTNASERPLEEPVRVLLTKHRHFAEDGHVDAVVWLDAPHGEDVEGDLDVRLHDSRGQEIARQRIDEIPDNRLFFSFAFPEKLAGNEGALQVRWLRPGQSGGEQTVGFEVESPSDPEGSGRVPLRIPESEGREVQAAPMTVGVPFPRGALTDAQHVRLVDQNGDEIPLQAKVTGRWSRFGSIRWLLCDFVVDVGPKERVVYLEYGVDVERGDGPAGVEVVPAASGFPEVDSGRIAIRENGVYFDADSDGSLQRVMPADAMHGGFVEHEDGSVYRMLPDREFEIEESGDEKAVIRTEGYYQEPGTGAAFCRYITRYVLHRDSTMIRIFHTWIFTGDGNTDRIRNMGWRFGLDDSLAPRGFLPAFDSDSWTQGDYLLQHDFDAYEVVADGEAVSRGQSAPGVAAASSDGIQVFLGIKDFWQNFPSEMEFQDRALYFHNWPRHGREPQHSPATVEDAIRLWFAHEGRLLDFELPPEWVDPGQKEHRGETIWTAMSSPSSSNIGRSVHWKPDEPETANAQGIARTEEMWLYFTEADQAEQHSVATLRGLNDETLRAVVDPKWLAESGAFYEIHHRDMEKHPQDERVYEQIAHAPFRWTDRIGTYGMWRYGDVMNEPRMFERTASLYRGMRKSHHGWPYSWIPFARSGDPRFLKYAETATRQMIDANFCHYYTDEIDENLPGDYHYRGIGFWERSVVPWTGMTGPGTRCYGTRSGFMWDAYHLTGFARARDVALLWGEHTKQEETRGTRGFRRGPIGRQYGWRGSVNMLKAYTRMYEATFDPWFVVAAHEIAQMHLHRHEQDGWMGHIWQPGKREFLRLTGDPDFKSFYLAYARERGGADSTHWAPSPQIEANAFAWWLTGDREFLRRTAHEVDRARQATYLGEPSYYRGHHIREAGWGNTPHFTGWYLQQFPFALAVLEAAEEVPAPLPTRFVQGVSEVTSSDEGYVMHQPKMAFRKIGEKPVQVDLTAEADRSGDGHYRLLGPARQVVQEGTWDLAEGRQLSVSADAAEGTYWLEVELHLSSRPSQHNYRRHTGLRIPVTPAGTPEVLLPEDASLGWAVWTSQYWFRMPEDVETFEAAFDVRGDHREVRRMSIWDGDGELAWDHNQTTYDLEPREHVVVEAAVDVPADQRGVLWRVTLPGRNGGFRFHGDIRPVFAVSSDRWFDPDQAP